MTNHYTQARFGSLTWRRIRQRYFQKSLPFFQPHVPGEHVRFAVLVEDESAILNVIMMILTRQGYTVLAATPPDEAIHMTVEHAGEITLLLMNGLAAKVLSLFPHIKRLFMSGYTADVIAHHGVLDEGVYFIQKPFSMPGLAAKVREVLDNGLTCTGF